MVLGRVGLMGKERKCRVNSAVVPPYRLGTRSARTSRRNHCPAAVGVQLAPIFEKAEDFRTFGNAPQLTSPERYDVFSKK